MHTLEVKNEKTDCINVQIRCDTGIVQVHSGIAVVFLRDMVLFMENNTYRTMLSI